jgi:uncharacterized protein (TIGR02594 family)
VTFALKPWGPPWLEWALGELGVGEAPGDRDNPRIRYYHNFTAAGEAPDSVPWCSSFVNAAMAAAVIKGTRSKAASSWAEWGIGSPLRLGAVLFFGKADPDAKGTGHVALCAGWSGKHVLALGGNQSNQVSAVLRPLERVEACRWPLGVP